MRDEQIDEPESIDLAEIDTSRVIGYPSAQRPARDLVVVATLRSRPLRA
jgi:hypothetical protein